MFLDGFPRPGDWIGIGFLLLILNAACGSRAPYLNPSVPGVEPSSGSHQVIVEVKPVETSGFRNSERERLGIDLSAYFTAFELKIRNQTSRTVTVEGQGAVLQDDSGTSYAVLSAEESLDYYQSGGQAHAATLVIPKSFAVVRKERERIRLLRLKSATIPAGESGHGMLLFRKVPHDQCHSVLLILKGVRIAGEDQDREFRFTFSCARP